MIGFLFHNARHFRFDRLTDRLLILAYQLGPRFDGLDLECAVWNAFTADYVPGAGVELWRGRLRNPERGW